MMDLGLLFSTFGPVFLAGSLPVKCCCAQARPNVNIRAHRPSPAG